MREMGIIWVILATLSVIMSFALVKSAQNQRELRAEQVVLAHESRVAAAQRALLVAQARDARETARAACTYRDFLKGEYVSGAAYLRQHPHGLASLGISATQIRQSIDKERAAYASLRGLNCTKRALGS
jgi:hypothetical protein